MSVDDSLKFFKKEINTYHYASGPLEFTKLTSQLAAKMNAEAKASSCAETMARVKRYEQKGAVSTLFTIAKYRGITGLYTGFHLHLGIPLSFLYPINLKTWLFLHLWSANIM